MANLREVDFFEPGCIGAEDVIADAKIQRKGHKLFIDPSNVMPHRRKPFKPYMKQMRNYGYTRMVANKECTIAKFLYCNRIFPAFGGNLCCSSIWGTNCGAADEYWPNTLGSGEFQTRFHGIRGLMVSMLDFVG